MGLGLLAGAALGYWLNSEQGKRVRRETSNQITDYSNQATVYTKDKIAQAQSSLSSAIEKGQGLLNDLSDYTRNFISSTASKAENAVDKTESSLERGMKKAKMKVDQQANNLEGSYNN